MDLTPGPGSPPIEIYALVRDVLGEETPRCSGCDHLLSDHSEGGCWYSVSTAGLGSDIVCVCVAEHK